MTAHRALSAGTAITEQFAPNGRGDAQYDFWSPLIVDIGDTLFEPDV